MGTKPQSSSLRASAVARQAAAPTPPPPAAKKSTSSDFDFDKAIADLKLGEPVDESDIETPSRVSAVFFLILGYQFIPVFKGITCGLLFAAIAYFAANGSLSSFIAKSASAADYADTAKTVENVAAGVGGYACKAYNFVVEKAKTLNKA